MGEGWERGWGGAWEGMGKNGAGVGEQRGRGWTGQVCGCYSPKLE